jgi:error-prone DNA polymerase
VPIFQEQVMQIAMLAAGFSAGEADSLRRSMAAWKRKGGVHKFHERIVGGMVERGYTEEFARGIFRQIEGFGEYGFPESHAASFALLVYVSCWLKRHEPACLPGRHAQQPAPGLLHPQPAGAGRPAPPDRSAPRRRHHQRLGLHAGAAPALQTYPYPVSESGSDPKFRPPQASRTLPTKSGSDPHFPNEKPEPSPGFSPPVRLGLRLVASLTNTAAKRILAARQHHPFTSTEDLALRAALDAGDLKALAAADALTALSGHRRQQVWDASALHRAPELLREAPTHEAALALMEAGEGEAIAHDYAATGLTLRRHPLALLRPELARWQLRTAAQLCDLPDGTPTRACGIVTVRQQPGTAKGVTFVTLEDETGTVNVIVWKALRERQRRELVHARLLAVQGTWQRDVESGGEVRHLIATRLRDLTPLLGDLMTGSRDFH